MQDRSYHWVEQSIVGILERMEYTSCVCNFKTYSQVLQEDILRDMVLERIRAVNEYVRKDAEGFQEEWLRCRRADQKKNIRKDKKKLEQAKKRLADLDALISHSYEDAVLGNLSMERYKKMSADYEAE